MMKVNANRENLLKYNKVKINHKLDLRFSPVAKPRMTGSDRWKKRPATLKYWDYRDRILYTALAQGYRPLNVLEMLFVFPVTPSWSKKKKEKMLWQPHEFTPDIDNLIKAILDSLWQDDRKVHTVHAKKIWGAHGRVIIKNLEMFDD